MATSVTQSLFGITPQSIQNERDTALQQQALQFAKLDPFESARMGLFQGASQLGTGIAGAMGYEDPEIAQARQRQGMLGGLNLNDPESLLTAAQNLQATDPMAAQALVTQATDLASKQAGIREKQYKMEQEQSAFQMRFGAVKSKYPKMSDEEARGLAEDTKTFGEVMKDTTQVVETAKGQILIDKRTGQEIANIGPAVDRRSTTNVNVNANKVEENAFKKKLGEVQGNRMGAAYEKRDAALRELSTFEQLATLPDNQLISGSLAEPRVEVANFLNTIGLASEKDAARVSSSQQFQKLSNDLVLARVKQLGYNPSDADRKFIEQTIPRLSSSVAARKALVNFMAKVARDVTNEVSAMEEYGMTNNTLSGYKPKIPQVSFSGAASKPATAMTDDELLEALKNSKK